MRRAADEHPEAQRIEVWFADETRVGQKGRLCRRWYQRGMRPPGRRDLGFTSAWIFGAACPARDEAVALVLPEVSAVAMQLFLDELARAVQPDAHALVLMDRAGWHVAARLKVPPNLTPLFLPPYSPELNPIERLWLHLKERFLSHRLFRSTSAIVEACCRAWNHLLTETGRIQSLCSYPWTQVRT